MGPWRRGRQQRGQARRDRAGRDRARRDRRRQGRARPGRERRDRARRGRGRRGRGRRGVIGESTVGACRLGKCVVGVSMVGGGVVCGGPVRGGPVGGCGGRHHVVAVVQQRSSQSCHNGALVVRLFRRAELRDSMGRSESVLAANSASPTLSSRGNREWKGKGKERERKGKRRERKGHGSGKERETMEKGQCKEKKNSPRGSHTLTAAPPQHTTPSPRPARLQSIAVTGRRLHNHRQDYQRPRHRPPLQHPRHHPLPSQQCPPHPHQCRPVRRPPCRWGQAPGAAPRSAGCNKKEEVDEPLVQERRFQAKAAVLHRKRTGPSRRFSLRG